MSSNNRSRAGFLARQFGVAMDIFIGFFEWVKVRAVLANDRFFIHVQGRCYLSATLTRSFRGVQERSNLTYLIKKLQVNAVLEIQVLMSQMKGWTGSSVRRNLVHDFGTDKRHPRFPVLLDSS